jgi:hypothetical protein
VVLLSGSAKVVAVLLSPSSVTISKIVRMLQMKYVLNRNVIPDKLVVEMDSV